MKYLITFNHVDGAWDQLSDEERERHTVWLREFVAELREKKNAELVFLSLPDDARTVRKHPGGHIEVSAGPALSSTEFPGGYYIIEAESLAEAVTWAEKGRFMVGSNEVRQILDLSF